MWWGRRRKRYNIGLVFAGILAFACYVVVVFWGISIGAINAAIIAGNEPKRRVERLREFWETITFDHLYFVPPLFKYLLTRDDTQQQIVNTASALRAFCFGIPGFFVPRPLSP